MNIELTNSQLSEKEILKHKFKDGSYPVSQIQALRYEIASSWIVGILPKESFPLRVLARYFAWKVGRKYSRYLDSIVLSEVIVQQQSPTNDPDTLVV